MHAARTNLLQLHAGHIRQMSITAPDLSTTDLTQYFHPSYSFIEEAISAERAVLLHCGAGSSRSATIAAGMHPVCIVWYRSLLCEP